MNDAPFSVFQAPTGVWVALRSFPLRIIGNLAWGDITATLVKLGAEYGEARFETRSAYTPDSSVWAGVTDTLLFRGQQQEAQDMWLSCGMTEAQFNEWLKRPRTVLHEADELWEE